MAVTRKGDARAVTLMAIAKRCRVAKSTVSLALRGDPRVEERTATRIRAAAEKMGYDSSLHDVARRLALRKTGVRTVSRVIGLLCPTHAYTFPFFTRLLEGVLETLSEKGFNVVTGTYQRKPSGEVLPQTSLHHLLCRGDLDGLIYYSDPKTFERVIEEARGHPGFGDRPVVSLLFAAAGCSAVLADEEEGGRRAARHLIELGHRHVLQFSTRYAATAGPVTVSRWTGVRRAFCEHSLEPVRYLRELEAPRVWVDPISVPHELGAIDRSGNGDDEGRQLIACLRAHPEITAILAQNDSAALNAWRVLHRAGRRIPQQISIVGFDDTDPMQDQEGRNLLTSVRLPLQEVGRRAGQIVLRRVLGEQEKDVEVILPAELMVRASTAAPQLKRT